jgi:glycine betaine/proline transport system ATP-binding protein
VLRKTIVFITHDFDEAIRLADRIAIMKDGAVVQVGTPEEIVLRPADSYVAAFTREVARAKVVRAGSLAAPADGRRIAGRVRAGVTIAEAAPLFAAQDASLEVVGEDGTALGVLDRAAVVRVLMEG